MKYIFKTSLKSVFLTLLVLSNCYASDWRYIPGRTDLVFDMASIQYKGALMRVWVSDVNHVTNWQLVVVCSDRTAAPVNGENFGELYSIQPGSYQEKLLQYCKAAYEFWK